MPTGRKIITDSMRLIEAIQAGELPEADEAADALDRLNEMMDTWNSMKLSTFATSRVIFSLTSGKQDYTLGPGPPTADFIAQRPSWVERMGIIQKRNINQPIELPLRILTVKQWAHEVPVKNISSALPTKVYIEYTYPNLKLSFWPFPNTGLLDIVVYTNVELSPWTDLDTDLTFPPGYREAIKYGLSVRLCPEFGRPVSEVVQRLADTTFDTVKSVNLANHQETLGMDEALTPGQVFDWRTGDPL